MPEPKASAIAFERTYDDGSGIGMAVRYRSATEEIEFERHGSVVVFHRANMAFVLPALFRVLDEAGVPITLPGAVPDANHTSAAREARE